MGRATRRELDLGLRSEEASLAATLGRISHVHITLLPLLTAFSWLGPSCV